MGDVVSEPKDAKSFVTLLTPTDFFNMRWACATNSTTQLSAGKKIPSNLDVGAVCDQILKDASKNNYGANEKNLFALPLKVASSKGYSNDVNGAFLLTKDFSDAAQKIKTSPQKLDDNGKVVSTEKLTLPNGQTSNVYNGLAFDFAYTATMHARKTQQDSFYDVEFLQESSKTQEQAKACRDPHASISAYECVGAGFRSAREDFRKSSNSR